MNRDDSWDNGCFYRLGIHALGAEPSKRHESSRIKAPQILALGENEPKPINAGQDFLRKPIINLGAHEIRRPIGSAERQKTIGIFLKNPSVPCWFNNSAFAVWRGALNRLYSPTQSLFETVKWSRLCNFSTFTAPLD